MRFLAALIASSLLAVLAPAPGEGPAPALSQAQATATPTATPLPGAPVVLSVSPSTIDAVNPGPIAVSVAGVNFLPGAVVALDGRPLPTTFAAPTLLTALVPPGLPAGTYSATVTNPGFFSSAPLANAITIANLASVLYVPVAVKQLPENSTSVYVQNVSLATTIVYVRYYDSNGFSDPSWARSAQIMAGGSVAFDQGADPALPAGFDGSAVVQSAQAITAVVNHVNSSGPIASTGGQAQAGQPRASAGSFSLSPGATSRASTVPVVFGGYNGYWTTLSVQNTGSSPATYTIALYPTGTVSPVATIARTIPPLAAARVRLGPEVGVPGGFVGTAVVSSPASAAAAAAETVHVESNVSFSYGALAAGMTRANAPLLFKNYRDWVTGAQVVNVSSSNVMVDATLHHRDGVISFGLPPRLLLPNESYTYYLPAIPQLPEGFVGSGVFTATGPIALVVQELNALRGAGMAYTGFRDGGPRVSAPVVFKGWNDWDTGIQVQNLGALDTIVTVRYFLPMGATALAVAEIPAGDSRTFYQPADPNLPPGLVGSALIESTNAQPIIAIVNEVNYARPGDASMVYEGINY